MNFQASHNNNVIHLQDVRIIASVELTFICNMLYKMRFMTNVSQDPTLPGLYKVGNYDTSAIIMHIHASIGGGR